MSKVKGVHYFGGRQIDAVYVIDRFRELMKLLPATTTGLPRAAMEPINDQGKKVKLPKRPAMPKPGDLKGGATLGKKDAKQMLVDAGENPDDVDRWLKTLKRGISVKEDNVLERLREKFQTAHSLYIAKQKATSEITKKKETQEQLQKLKEEAKDEKEESNIDAAEKAVAEEIKSATDEKKTIEHEEKKLAKQLEKEANAEAKLVKSKSDRLANILAKQYNFGNKTKMPKGLEQAFLQSAPIDEDDIITKYSDQLESIKVKEDEKEATGKKKDELESQKIHNRMMKLFNKNLKVKKAVQQAATPIAVPKSVKVKIQKKSRGKVKTDSKGRGESKKSTVKKIKVLI